MGNAVGIPLGVIAACLCLSAPAAAQAPCSVSEAPDAIVLGEDLRLHIACEKPLSTTAGLVLGEDASGTVAMRDAAVEGGRLTITLRPLTLGPVTLAGWQVVDGVDPYPVAPWALTVTSPLEAADDNTPATPYGPSNPLPIRTVRWPWLLSGLGALALLGLGIWGARAWRKRKRTPEPEPAPDPLATLGRIEAAIKDPATPADTRQALHQVAAALRQAQGPAAESLQQALDTLRFAPGAPPAEQVLQAIYDARRIVIAEPRIVIAEPAQEAS